MVARPEGMREASTVIQRKFPLLSIMLFCGVLACGSAWPRNVALLIGVGRFSDPGMDLNNRLLGTDPDLDAMQEALIGWQFDPKDIKVLRNRDATHDQILAQIAALEQRSVPGDTVLLYYSGHGTSANDEDNMFDLPYATGAWVPYDFDPNDFDNRKSKLIIGRRDLVGPLSKLDQGGRFVVVISDSCFSGQVVRSFGAGHSHTRYLPLKSRDLGVAAASPAPAVAAPSVRPPPPPYPYVHVVLLSAASDSESGADLSTQRDLEIFPTLDGKFHGAFTDAVLRLMGGQLTQAGGGPMLPGTFTYSQGKEAVRGFLESRHLAQHPQLLPALAEDKEDVGALPFLKGTPAPGAVAATSATPGAFPAAAAGRATLRVRLESAPAGLKSAIAALAGVTVVDGESPSDLIVRQHDAQIDVLGAAGDPILTAAASDPNITKRISAQAWLDRALPRATDRVGLRAETDPGSRGSTFVQCESFVFEVRLEKPAYVMLLDLDPQGGLTVLYPARASERKLIASGAPQAIPGSRPQDRIVVTPPFGTDEVTVLAFEQPPNFLVELTGSQRFETSDGRAELLARGLAQSVGAVSVQRLDVHTYAGHGKTSCGA